MAALDQLPLISTVAVGLSAAFVLGLAATKLRISPIVGYLLAGILVGPHTPGFHADMKIAEELSEIGVVLLMFGVGLHFSIQDFMEVRKIALTGAIGRIIIGTGLGIGLAWLWHWPITAGVIFGLALSVASTVVLLRALEARNMVQSMEGKIAIGWLIVEDLVMILAMVLIPALAAAGKNAEADYLETGKQLGIAIGKVLVFVVIMLVAGKRVLPWILSAVSRTGSRELFTLAVFAMAMGTAFGAQVLFGVSFALGAFFAGMMIRESDLNHEVADRALPFQDAFAVLFFVSIGMIFNPGIVLDQPFNVLAVIAIITIGKTLVSWLIVAAFGYPLRTSAIVAIGLAQIGEFSFILVGLGLSLKLLPDMGRDLVLAGAIASIALNPILFYFGKKAYTFVGKSPNLSRRFNLRDDDLAHLRTDEKRALKDLVILVGVGRVGKHIIQHIHERHVDLVIIERNREKVEYLRGKGFHAIYGDASQPEVLNEAAIQKALAILVTVPDPFEARNIVETARGLKPYIRVIVKAQNDDEVEYFAKKNVQLAVAAPREVSRRMLEHLDGLQSP
ncbi:MAG TPA: YbaL family putative K(+) efflux transporter [Patescibacteria group bacterium]|nr:YbaL family putative K(+) efflux transporter [Patescibacteria group bacterium]